MPAAWGPGQVEQQGMGLEPKGSQPSGRQMPEAHQFQKILLTGEVECGCREDRDQGENMYIFCNLCLLTEKPIKMTHILYYCVSTLGALMLEAYLFTWMPRPDEDKSL